VRTAAPVEETKEMAMATATMVPGRGERFGLVAARVIAAGLFSLLMLNLMAVAVRAEPSPGSYQNGFTNACRDHGGTPKRVRTRVVKCTLTDGTTITCDFNVNPPSCTTTPPARQDVDGGVVADLDDAVLTDAGLEPSAPDSPTEAVAASSGNIIFVVDDEER
jgi:hypothetical protein